MVKVDETKCIGCGACVAVAPDNFDFNDAGLSYVKKDEISDSVKEAMDACPVGAIVEVAAENAQNESNIVQFPTKEENEEEKAA